MSCSLAAVRKTRRVTKYCSRWQLLVRVERLCWREYKGSWIEEHIDLGG